MDGLASGIPPLFRMAATRFKALLTPLWATALRVPLFRFPSRTDASSSDYPGLRKTSAPRLGGRAGPHFRDGNSSPALCRRNVPACFAQPPRGPPLDPIYAVSTSRWSTVHRGPQRRMSSVHYRTPPGFRVSGSGITQKTERRGCTCPGLRPESVRRGRVVGATVRRWSPGVSATKSHCASGSSIGSRPTRSSSPGQRRAKTELCRWCR